MNRLSALFQTKTSRLLSIYFTAGYPSLHDTAPIITELSQCGVDFIEIGMPFSDPVADGPTIQHSSEIALENGMNTHLLFEQLKNIREITNVPLLLMGYINPVLQYGIDAFCQKAAEIGIDGFIFPDLPMQIYLEEYQSIFEKYGLVNVFLITPQSSDERVRWIDTHTQGFIYMVSTYSTTGSRTGISDEQTAYFKRIQSLGLKNPAVVGFGISDKESFDKATQHTQGAIIGSAFVKCLSGEGTLSEKIRNFIHSVRS